MQSRPLSRAMALVIGCALLSGASLRGHADTPQADGRTPAVRTVVTDGQVPGAKEPQAAIGAGKQVYVAFGAKDTLYAVVSTDGGATYGAPVRVGAAGKLSLGMRRGPRIVATRDGAVITATYGAKGGGSDGDLLAWRTADGGKTWLGPTRVTDVAGAAREGLHAMAAAPDGTVACAWLDLREPGTQVFAAFSRDGGKTWGKNVRVYRSPAGNVCECCHPSLAYDARNRLHVMWRNWLNGSRDMYATSTSDAGRTFAPARKLGNGTWPLNACPMDGGALTVSRGQVTTFWRRENTMYLAGASGTDTSEVKVGDGQQGWIAATARGTYLVWLSGASGSSLLVSTPKTAAPQVLAASAVNPMVTAIGGPTPRVVAVWSDEQGIRSALLEPGT